MSKRLQNLLLFASIISFNFAISSCGNSSSDSKASTPPSAKDQDGNNYKTAQIGDQLWMAENLSTSKFRNGDPIMEAKNYQEWSKAGSEQKAAYCYYEFKAENGKAYGKLYNWYAVTDDRGLAPEGWKVPSVDDFSKLQSEIGEGSAGKALKSESGWSNDGNGTNSSGFNALPAGAMNPSSMNMGSAIYFWTSDEMGADKAQTQFLGYWGDMLDGGSYGKVNGFSVRCLAE